jgi:formate--tetrahydrofolate ligase
VDYTPLASRQLDGYEKNGFGSLPVCIAKTQYSLSHDANLKGAPTGFRLPVREAKASVGAGFIYLICGDMRTMPGLAGRSAAISIDVDENGEIVGLY